MPGHLLDTDTCILYLAEHAGVRRRVESAGGLKRMSVSAVTVAELLTGAYHPHFRERDLKASKVFIRRLSVLPFDRTAALRFAAIRPNLEIFREKQIRDLMNACIALTHDYTMVTNNTKDYYPIPGLRVVNWAADL